LSRFVTGGQYLVGNEKQRICSGARFYEKPRSAVTSTTTTSGFCFPGFYGFYICSQWAFIHALLSHVPFALAGLSCFTLTASRTCLFSGTEVCSLDCDWVETVHRYWMFW